MNEKAKYTPFRDTAVTNTPTSVRSGPTTLFGWNLINTNAYAIYLKTYNIASGDVTVGTSAVTDTIQIPASSSVVLRGDLRGESYDTALTIAVTKEAADNDATVVVALPIIKLFID